MFQFSGIPQGLKPGFFSMLNDASETAPFPSCAKNPHTKLEPEILRG